MERCGCPLIMLTKRTYFPYAMEKIDCVENGGTRSSKLDPVPEIPVAVITDHKEIPSSMPNDQLLMGKDSTIRDQEDILSEIPKPPDGGYGWVIVSAGFFLNFVTDGLQYSYGIILPQIAIYYSTTIAKASWVGSLFVGVHWICGPLVAVLINKYGFRIVGISGSLITTGAFLLGTLSPNVEVLMLLNGFVGGIGAGFIHFVALLCVGYYFSTKRAFALGLSMCGSSIGTFVIAPLAQLLFDSYGWKGAIIILSGVTLNCAVACALIRPLKLNVKKSKRLKPKTQLEDDHNTPLMYETLNLNGETLDVFKEDNPRVLKTSKDVNSNGKEKTRSMDSFDIPMNISDQSNENGRSFETEQQNNNNSIRAFVNPDKVTEAEFPAEVIKCQTNVNRKLSLPTSTLPNFLYTPRNHNGLATQPYNFLSNGSTTSGQRGSFHRMTLDQAESLCHKDSSYRKSIGNLTEFGRSLGDMDSCSTIGTTLPLRKTSEKFGDPEKENTVCTPCFELSARMMHIFGDIFHINLLAEHLYLCLCIVNFITFMAYLVPFVYFSNCAIVNGIDPQQASFLISVMGIANILGRVCFGWLVDLQNVQAIDVHNSSLLICGVITFSMPFCFGYIGMMFAAFLYGFFAAGFIVTTAIVLVDIFGVDRLTNSFGVLGVFRGTAIMLGLPFAATLSDLAGTINVAFFSASGFYLLASISLFLASRLQCHKKEGK